MDQFIIDDPSIHDHTDSSAHNHIDSSIHDWTNPSVYSHTDYSGSDISAYLPPSSNAATEVSSAVPSDSDLPPPPLQSTKPMQQTGLHNFFSVVPADEAHAAWGKRKRDNQGRDEEERAEIKCQEEEWREEKRQKRSDDNRIAQQKHHRMVEKQEQKAGTRDKDGIKLPVSEMFALETANS